MEKDSYILNERQKIISALASARIKKGISQQTLADAVGMQKSNICRIESGGQNISLDMLLKITNALGLYVSMILEERKTEPDDPISEYSLRLYDEELLTFKFAYSRVPQVAGSRNGSGPVDANIANLVFVRGLQVVEQGVPAPISHTPSDLGQLIQMLQK